MIVTRIVPADPFLPFPNAAFRTDPAGPSSALIDLVIEHADRRDGLDERNVELRVSEAKVQSLLLKGTLHRRHARLSDVRVRWDEREQQMVDAWFLDRPSRCEEDALWEEFRARAA